MNENDNEKTDGAEGNVSSPNAGDIYKIEVEGMLTDGVTYAVCTHVDDLRVSDDGKRLVLDGTKAESLCKKFAVIETILVKDKTGWVEAIACNTVDKYVITCGTETAEHVLQAYAYPAGAKHKSPKSDKTYTCTRNGKSVMTLIRQMIARRYGLTGGTSESKQSASEAKKIIETQASKLAELEAANAALLVRLLALESQAAVKEAAPVKARK